MTTPPSRFVWYDLMTSDTRAAESFYKNAIGWEARDSGMADRAYTIFSIGQAMVGGLMPIPEEGRAMGARPGWLGYIGVDDVDACATRLKTAGGNVHRPPEDIPGVGRFCVVADPRGAGFILFKGLGEAQSAPAAPMAPGHIGWHELQADNADDAFAFYAGLFGWTKAEAIDMGPMGVYQTFASGGAAVGGMMKKMPEAPAPFWLYYFNVEALDAAVARVTQGGGKPLIGAAAGSGRKLDHAMPGPAGRDVCHGRNPTLKGWPLGKLCRLRRSSNHCRMKAQAATTMETRTTAGCITSLRSVMHRHRPKMNSRSI